MKRMRLGKGLDMKLYNIKIIKLVVFGAFIMTNLLFVSCEKHKDEEIAFDQSRSEEWDNVFLDASKIFKVGEIKKIVFENPYNANQCILIQGGTSIEESDAIYNEYIDNGIPAIVAEKLVREDLGEWTNLYFLKDNVFINSIKVIHVDSEDRIYYTKVGEQIVFSIRLPPQFVERIKNDPTFFNHPEIGQDYLTNSSRSKPIEIINIE